LQLPQPFDQAIGPGAEVAEARVFGLRHRLERWLCDRDRGDHPLRVDGSDAGAFGELGRAPRLLGSVDRGSPDRYHRRLGRARRRQRLLDPIDELGDQRRPFPLRQQPVLRAVAGGGVHRH